MSPKRILVIEGRKGGAPSYLCECRRPRRVDLVKLECGDLAGKGPQEQGDYWCPAHGSGMSAAGPAWSYCYKCKGLIEAQTQGELTE